MADNDTRQVTSLDEIRAQAEVQVIDIPGFRTGTKITVEVQPVDLTPHLLTVGLVSPVLGIAMKKAQEGKTREEIEAEINAEVTEEVEAKGGRGLDRYLPVMDAVCKEALVRPTWDEITAIRPLNLSQKIEIFNAATGDVKILQSFRRE
ncbi:MAG: hypothetical protein WD024_06815 [Bacillota bacterium]